MAIEILETVEKSKLFGGLSPLILDKIVNASKHVQAGAGEILFQQGDAADAVWGVVSGRVSETIRNEDGQEITVNLIEPGDVFGEVAVLDWGQRRVEAMAVEDSTLFRINRPRFLELLQESPELCFRMFALLCNQVRGSTGIVEGIALHKLPTRLANKLLELANTPQGTIENQDSTEIRISQINLGHLIGVNREAINRQLRKWEKKGQVSLGRGRIILRDLEALTAVAAPMVNGASANANSVILNGENPIVSYPMRSPQNRGNSKKSKPDGPQDAGLVAVVVSDYSKQMMKNTSSTLRALNAGLAAIEKSVLEGKGEIIGQVGDSIIASFPDGQGALKAARTIQKNISSGNRAKTPGLFRLGVHQGTVIKNGNHYTGPDINVALHVAQAAGVGGLYLTDAVYKSEAKIHPQTSFLGNQSFADIETPVPIYSLEAVPLMKQVGLRYQSVRHQPWWPATAISTVLAFMVLSWFSIQKIQPATIITVPDNSIAVLPFGFQGEDESNSFLGGALSLELGQMLTGFESLRVTGQDSIKQFTAANLQLDKASENLKVSYVLVGEIKDTGEALEIQTQLIKADDNSVLWASDYNSNASNLFSVQQDIAAHVLQAMNLNDMNAGNTRAPQPLTHNPDAYALYLRARHLISAGMATRSITALPLLEEAIELDPDFAEVYALLAGIYLGSPPALNLLEMKADEQFQKALMLANKAYELNPESPQALAKLSLVKWQQGNFADSKILAEKAVVLDGDNTEALWALHEAYFFEKDWGSALSTLETLYTIEPMSLRALSTKTRYLVAAGKHEEAYRLAKRVKDISTDQRLSDILVAQIALAQGNYIDAVRHIRQAKPLGFNLDLWFGMGGINYDAIQPVIFRSGIFAYSGAFEQARRAITETYANNPDSPEYFIAMAEIETLAGNYNEAITHFENVLPMLPNETIGLIWTNHYTYWISVHRKSMPALAFLYAYRQTGQDDKADALAGLIGQEIKALRQQYSAIGGTGKNQFLYQEAQLLAIEGKKTEALETLRRWRRVDPEQFNYLRSDPFFKNLHEESEFWQIVADLETELAALRERIKAADAAS